MPNQSHALVEARVMGGLPWAQRARYSLARSCTSSSASNAANSARISLARRDNRSLTSRPDFLELDVRARVRLAVLDLRLAVLDLRLTVLALRLAVLARRPAVLERRAELVARS